MNSVTLPTDLISEIFAFVGDEISLRAIKITSKRNHDSIAVHLPMEKIQCARCKSNKRWRITSNSFHCHVPRCQARGLHYMISYFTVNHLPVCSFACLCSGQTLLTS